MAGPLDYWSWDMMIYPEQSRRIYPIFFLSSKEKEVSQKIRGLLSFSIDQSVFLKSPGFSNLKRERASVVTCKLRGESLLCSRKNCCFLLTSLS